MNPSETNPLLTPLLADGEFIRLLQLQKPGSLSSVFGLGEAHKAQLAAALYQRGHTVLLAAESETAATRMQRDIAATLALQGKAEDCLLFPVRDVPFSGVYAASQTVFARRVQVLCALTRGEPVIVVASPKALLQRLAPPRLIREAVFTLRPGDVLSPRTLLSRLVDSGYERVELVEGPGQIALRGDRLDVFPVGADYPCRVEYFDDEIDQLRLYDPLTQRSLEQAQVLQLTPAAETPQDGDVIRRGLAAIGELPCFASLRVAWEQGRPAMGGESLVPALYREDAVLTDYLADTAVVLLSEPAALEQELKLHRDLFWQEYQAALEQNTCAAVQKKLILTPEQTLRRLREHSVLQVFSYARALSGVRTGETARLSARPAPVYPAGTGELAGDLQRMRNTGEAVLLLAGDRAKQLQAQLLDCGCEAALVERLIRLPEPGEVWVAAQPLPRGFCWPELHLTVLGEAELFGRERGESRKSRPRRENRLLLSEIRPGDYVVHEAHGVGRFVGVQPLQVQNTTRDYLLLQYAGTDQLFIPVDQLDRVQKYVGAGEAAPKLNRLGGADWNRQVGKARSAVKKLAIDLAQLYASRNAAKGFAFSADNEWQEKMEAAFPYEETPDQLRCVEEIKADMERNRPMDRLLCGDVGYGKTEVALRAAFKAVQDSKQVAILAPTTILAQQHYNTALARFSKFPVNVALLSRFRTPQQQKDAKKALAEGRTDILVGTHAVLAKDVKFKDLGLLIIDEEQRFGVGQKEQIKAMKANVDVLSLSATPIPRTLHMSMLGIRDMSVIETPPEQRYPVQTFVMEYSPDLIREAVQRETGRGGQVFVVSNDVQRMEGLQEKLGELLPGVRILMAHGQMPERLLEQTMLEFLEGRGDVLLCSTIIENGLDIPNANTMIVLDADKLGLSQLYQLKGRVGRSSRMGWAYFTFRRDKELTEVARKRLTALREFTQFGAGFALAMRDLEIRGAGSLLGAEQHGHIADVGYEYYCKLMREAVREQCGEPEQPETDTVADAAVDAFIPHGYIPTEVQRLQAYQRIARIAEEQAMDDVRDELEDRYGDVPPEVENLMWTAWTRSLCARAGISQFTIRDGEWQLYFPPQSRMDGMALVRIAQRCGGRLAGKDTVRLIKEEKKKTAAELLRKMPSFVCMILDCIDESQQL